MRSFLSRLRTELERVWVLCGAYLFGRRSFAWERLPVWSDEAEEFPTTRLPLNGKRKDQWVDSARDLHRYRAAPVSFPPMMGLYTWRDPLALPQPGEGVLLFTAACSSDVHVALSPVPESANPMYEFVIGGWSNTVSVVRRRSQGENLCTVPVGLKQRQEDAVTELWISIDKTTRLIRIGYGKEPGFDSMFLVYRDPLFLADVKYVCFSTWTEPAAYSDVVVLAIR